MSTKVEGAQVEELDDPYEVKAGPTKELFIYMLVRDLSLRDAIGDLVDNSIDAVRKIIKLRNDAPSEFTLISNKYRGFTLTLTLDEDRFIIEDNCGGMDVTTAREYAFRFGRDPDAPPTPGSIGQFGIGMKRALFKLGRQLVITSRAESSSFTMKIDVDTWAADRKNWSFRFDTYDEEAKYKQEERGMRIEITRLNPDVAEMFRDSAKNLFESRLIKEIGNENLFSINNGFTIKINNHTLKPRQLEILTSPEFSAGIFEQSYMEMDERGQQAEVHVRIITGIGESKLADGGWYIFCNERLVLGPDQTDVSGWTGTSSDGGPKYHGQYERFRGYVFFTSDNAGVLPWNTTKTSMDMDSKLYQAVRQVMIRMMSPVNTFLNNLKKEREKDNPASNRPLQAAMEKTVATAVLAVQPEQQATQFTAPKPAASIRTEPDTQVIKYTVPTDKFDRVKEALGARRKDQVGPLTFEYYYRNEAE
jgi:hypothetical protein